MGLEGIPVLGGPMEYVILHANSSVLILARSCRVLRPLASLSTEAGR